MVIDNEHYCHGLSSVRGRLRPLTPYVAIQENFELPHERLRYDGFGDVAIEAGRQYFFAIACHRGGRYGDDWDLAPLCLIAQVIQDLVSVHHGQVKIANDQVWLCIHGQLRTRATVARANRAISRATKQILRKRHTRRIIFDNQDAGAHVCGT
jgi:hypothetical protein